MTTEADRLTTVETKLDGFIEETRSRFNDMNTRMNVQFQANIAMWVTTMMAVLGTLAVILVKL